MTRDEVLDRLARAECERRGKHWVAIPNRERVAFRQIADTHILSVVEAADFKIEPTISHDDDDQTTWEQVDAMAKAMCWQRLNDKGRRECTWPGDFGPNEIAQARNEAIAARAALIATTKRQARSREKMNDHQGVKDERR